MLPTRARKIVAGVLLIAVAGVIAWAVVSRLERGEAVQTTQGREPGAPAVSLRESTVQHSEGGQPAWRLSINQIDITGGGQAVGAAGLREGLVYDNGKPVVRISAGEATYNTSDKSFEVTGDVKVVSNQGAVITTAKVQWVPTSQTLHCPGEVTMRGEGMTLRTDSLDLVVPRNLVQAPGRVQLRTGDGQLTGRELAYHLDTGAYTLRSIQAVFTVESAREELGRLR